MTTPIVEEEILSAEQYGQHRDRSVREMIEMKRRRRVRLHPNISLLFENHDTVHYQIQELVFGEDLDNEDEIREYIEIYSPMLPNEGELSATMFIELDNQERLEEMLKQLKGIEHHLYLEVNGERIPAVFEEEHDDRDFTTSVHYLKFPLTSAARTAFRSNDPDNLLVQLILDHQELKVTARLEAPCVASLAQDLAD